MTKFSEKEIWEEMKRVNDGYEDLTGQHRRSDILYELRLRAIENLEEKEANEHEKMYEVWRSRKTNIRHIQRLILMRIVRKRIR